MADVREGSLGKPAQISEEDLAAYKRQRQVMENVGQLLGQVQWAPASSAWGGGVSMAGLISRAGEHIPAAPEGHLFTDVGKAAIGDFVQYRTYRDQLSLRIPDKISKAQYMDIMQRAKEFGSTMLDRIGNNRSPFYGLTPADLRAHLLPRVTP